MIDDKFYFHQRVKGGSFFDMFVDPSNDKRTCAFFAWGHHARCAFKDVQRKIVYIIDPWKQSLGKTDVPQIIASKGYKCEFIKRTPEQRSEGSCSAIAFMRCIMAAKFGFVGLTMDIPLEYIVLTSRLISKFRNAKSKTE